MKVREGFVANSSSCCFTVELIEGIDFKKIWDLIYDNLPDVDFYAVNVYVTLKDKYELKDIFKTPYPKTLDIKEDLGFEEYDYSYGLNDGQHCYETNVESLFGEELKRYNPDWTMVEKLRFECDDYESFACFVLNSFYTIFSSYGLKVEDTGDRSFNETDNFSKMCSLVDICLEKKKEEK